ncbi:MAG: hypothetical protein KF767_07235 [Bdellovibrionaceae bacterium]|nr:hypothetical protein [Pseudobdellovibrionaceae bacterium]
MGAMTRFLAESASRVTVVEGTRSRAEVLQSRVRDLENIAVHIGDFKAFESDELYDRVVVIGVLEYADVIWGGESPFLDFLTKCRKHLRPEGQLILAIENRLGFKYFNGATEDHTAQLFDGIVGYKGARSPRTFSRHELQELFSNAGFGQTRFSYPVPDYKMPKGVLQQELFDLNPSLFKELSLSTYSRDYSGHRSELVPDELFVSAFSDGQLLDQFSNSFLIQASPLGEVAGPRELATLYSSTTSPLTQTQFTERQGQIEVTKSHIHGPTTSKGLKWIAPPPTIVKGTTPVSFALLRSSYFNDDNRFDQIWAAYEALITQSRDGTTVPSNQWDLIPRNIIQNDDGLTPIDLEWELNEDLEISYLIYRGISSLSPYVKSYLAERFGTLDVFYQASCERLAVLPELDRWIGFEIQVQVELNGQSGHFEDLKADFIASKRPQVRITDLGRQLSFLTREREILLAEQVRLNAELRTFTDKLARIHRLPGMKYLRKFKRFAAASRKGR